MIINIPFDSSYGDEKVSIDLPDSWDVNIYNISGAKPLYREDIQNSFESPIGAPRISELASKQKKVAVVVEDISRPSPTPKLIPFVLDELKKGGVPYRNITFVMATGAHRLQGREDMIKKLGKHVCEKYSTQSHSFQENLAYLGKTSFGNPIYLNKTVLEADLKIGVGGIYPHGSGVGGFGGGAKILVPGVAGLDTITQNHLIQGFGNQRKEMIEVARKIGFNTIVDAVIDCKKNIVGLFVGDLVEAHRKGVKFAEKAYKINPMSSKVDIAITDAYPMDIDLGQASKALPVSFNCLNEGGTVVLAASCNEGGGYHAVYHKGGTLWKNYSRSFKRWICDKKLLIFSPNLTEEELNRRFPKGPLLFNSWTQARRFLEKTEGKQSKVAIFPCGSISVTN